MQNDGHNENVMATMFSSTLRGAAIGWFLGLQPGSIRSHGQLMTLFLGHFSNFKRKMKPCGHLAGIIQRKDETLKDFIHRFNTGVHASEKHELSTRIQYMYSNTTSHSLARELVEHPPESEYDLDRLRDRLSSVEETVRTIPVRAPRARSPPQRPDHYTNLRKPRGEILIALALLRCDG